METVFAVRAVPRVDNTVFDVVAGSQFRAALLHRASAPSVVICVRVAQVI